MYSNIKLSKRYMKCGRYEIALNIDMFKLSVGKHFPLTPAKNL